MTCSCHPQAAAVLRAASVSIATRSEVPNRVRHTFRSAARKMLSQTSPTLVPHDVEETESGAAPGYNPLTANISQIPGLSPLDSYPAFDDGAGRRNAIHDTDSEYIKLAKQGGHKGLLRHEPTAPAKPHPYTPPSWNFYPSEDKRNPSLNNTVEKKIPEVFQPLEPPFGTDSMTAWERNGTTRRKDKNNNGHHNQQEKLTANQNLEFSKFRRMVHDKKPAPIDMSKLLSFGYADEDKPNSRH